MNIDIDDVMFFAGVASTATGLWIFSPAVSLAVTGAIFMIVGFLRAGGD